MKDHRDQPTATTSSSAIAKKQPNKVGRGFGRPYDHHQAPAPVIGNNSDILTLTSQVASAYFQNNNVSADEVASVIANIHQSLTTIQNGINNQTPPKGAVPIEDSINPDYIICLEDGKKLKMLKRHLRANFNLSPEEYRAKWGLPPTYPMVAPNYAILRSGFARQSGLGKSNHKNNGKN